MTTKDRTRLGVGGLLIAASFAVGAGSDGFTSDSNDHAPLLPPVYATVPLRAAPAVELPGTRERAADERAAAAVAMDDVPTKPVVDFEADAAVPGAEPLLVLEGSASWYSDALAGRRTASGVAYDPTELIAAHRALPFGTRLRVTNLENDRSVEVRVIDRGPFVAGRILDLSRSAAEQIGILRAGHGRVRVEVLEYGG